MAWLLFRPGRGACRGWSSHVSAALVRDPHPERADRDSRPPRQAIRSCGPLACKGMVFVLSSVGLLQSRVYAMHGVPPCGVPPSSTRCSWVGWGACCAPPSPPPCRPGRSCSSASASASSGQGPRAGSWWHRSRGPGHGRLGAAALAGEPPDSWLLGDGHGAALRRTAPLGLRTAAAAGGVGRPLEAGKSAWPL